MDYAEVTNKIITWLKAKVQHSNQKGFVVGISGGIDSAVVSALCARTGLPVMCVSLPIHQAKDQVNRADEHGTWITKNFTNVTYKEVDLTEYFEAGYKTLPSELKTELTEANMRSRCRMVVLYGFANSLGYLVAGTGNKVEDFGVGFFTKYGDGGVDISPIGDLLKTQVYELAKYLGVVNSIQVAKPTDGLWGDNRSDEDAIGATYPELEWAMDYCTNYRIRTVEQIRLGHLTDRQIEVLKIYITRHNNSEHKMNTPPICYLDENK